MPNEPSGSLGTTLRPSEAGAWLSGGFIFLLAIAIGIGLGAGAAFLSKLLSQVVIGLAVATGLACILNIIFSQVAAQTLLFVRFDNACLTFRTLLASCKTSADAVRTIYFAPNIHYINIIIDTKFGPQLLSDAIWTSKSFDKVQEELRRWAESENLQVLDVNTAWAKTENDRHARHLLQRCFRKPLLFTLVFLMSVAGVSFLVTALIQQQGFGPTT